ncbi:uncharacterized protein L969DRAFT_87130 [Mixia osmundae IAM 14324]|uniref:PHD-type domain-containing protein n=1 Tax=Mixia osmundae (strain CBS 9802 / IAM 14324 / JCM 22182 / KY 12970) TaxID=764103 RepID=G7E8C3_MIXOS|nr:uncharacterized protein L969DRAFT_87130 [Mixia osmundae IAM 14324]KEI39186.1 hypothetical protein L969DRAFT_87130 [Mixia osmundae IAM 14324]GAA99083.1 hypothetical protein E5Q_05772 [Mixia osmundae IAM 14324]
MTSEEHFAEIKSRFGKRPQDLDGAWGRLVVTGCTDWATAGRKAVQNSADVTTPSIVRSVAHVAFRRIFTSHSGATHVAIDINGTAWLWGRNEHGALGTNAPDPVSGPVSLLNSSFYPANTLPSGLSQSPIVHAAIGRHHLLLVTEAGEVYAAGANAMGQCGQDDLKDLHAFKRVVAGGIGKEKAIQVAAGINYSLILTTTGRVYAFGSHEKGVLGSGKTGEYITGKGLAFQEQPTPMPVRGLEGKDIIQISSGQQHNLALDSDGYLYAWGYSALGRTGMGNQVDLLVAKPVSQFAQTNVLMRASYICCGPQNSFVIDGQRMLYLFGRWKTSGDGSSGQPWMHPRPVHEIQAYKQRLISLGGATLFAVADDEGTNNVTIGWGQNCTNGELGLGVDQRKSATLPIRVETLDGLQILDLAAGQNTTYFLVRPPHALEVLEKLRKAVARESDGTPASTTSSDVWSQLPRWPETPDTPDICIVCKEDRGETDPPLECDRCEYPYHLSCTDPRLEKVPDSEWFCDDCLADSGEQRAASSGKKRKVDAFEDQAAKGKTKAPKGKKKAR